MNSNTDNIEIKIFQKNSRFRILLILLFKFLIIIRKILNFINFSNVNSAARFTEHQCQKKINVVFSINEKQLICMFNIRIHLFMQSIS